MGRTYTIQQRYDVPCLTLRGKWLRDFGLDHGNKLKLIKGKNMLVLIKIPDEAVKEENRNKEIKRLEKQVKLLKGAV